MVAAPLVDFHHSLLGDKHPHTLRIISGSTEILSHAGRVSDAVRVRKEAYETARSLYGPDHIDTNILRLDYGRTLRYAGQLKEAEEILTAALQAATERFGPDSPERVDFLQARASARGRAQEFQLARDDLGEAIRIIDLNGLPPNTDVLVSLSHSLHAQGESERARAMLKEALDILRIERPDSINFPMTQLNLAYVETDLGLISEALATATSARRRLAELSGPNASLPHFVDTLIGELMRTQGDFKGSQMALERAVEGLEPHQEFEGLRLAAARAQLAITLHDAPVGEGRDRLRAQNLMRDAIGYYRSSPVLATRIEGLPGWAKRIR